MGGTVVSSTGASRKASDAQSAKAGRLSTSFRKATVSALVRVTAVAAAVVKSVESSRCDRPCSAVMLPEHTGDRGDCKGELRSPGVDTLEEEACAGGREEQAERAQGAATRMGRRGHPARSSPLDPGGAQPATMLGHGAAGDVVCRPAGHVRKQRVGASLRERERHGVARNELDPTKAPTTPDRQAGKDEQVPGPQSPVRPVDCRGRREIGRPSGAPGQARRPRRAQAARRARASRREAGDSSRSAALRAPARRDRPRRAEPASLRQKRAGRAVRRRCALRGAGPLEQPARAAGLGRAGQLLVEPGRVT